MKIKNIAYGIVIASCTGIVLYGSYKKLLQTSSREYKNREIKDTKE